MTTRRRRFGSLRRLSSGRWQARYRGPDGRSHSAPETFTRKSEAERYLALVEAEISRGRWLDTDAGHQSVGEWAERWLASVSPHLKAKTRATYESLLRGKVLPRFAAVPVSSVRPIMVTEWVGSLSAAGLSPSRVRQSYRLLSQIMAAAVANDLIAASPCRGVRLPRMPQTEPHILTVVEVERLAAVCREPHGLLVQLLAYGGLRIGEAFALRRRHIKEAAGVVVVTESLSEIAGRHSFDTPKSHQRREVALPESVVGELRRHLREQVAGEPDALLFVGRTGRPLHYNSWRRTHFDPGVEAAGLVDVTPHDLRATHATWVADAHGVMAAARRLGHSNASVTTRHYARVVEGRDAEIAVGLGEARRAARSEMWHAGGTSVADSADRDSGTGDDQAGRQR
jgi:integrase